MCWCHEKENIPESNKEFKFHHTHRKKIFIPFRYDSDKEEIVMVAFRREPAYITYYIFWSKFILVELIPYVTIIVLNSMIMHKIHSSKKFQSKFRAQGTVRSTKNKKENNGNNNGSQRSSRRAAQENHQVQKV